MAKATGTYESPQAARDGLATVTKGGMAPSKEAIIESANARAQKRHEMKGQSVADEKVLPDSGGQSVEKTGVKDSGYLTKKGLVYGISAMYNSLPPGSDIEDQEQADIRTQALHTWAGGLSYPGDGW